MNTESKPISSMTKEELIEKKETGLLFFERWHDRISAYLDAAENDKKIKFDHFENDQTDPTVTFTKVSEYECPPSEESFKSKLAFLVKVREALKEK